jgi:hypothetical protein
VAITRIVKTIALSASERLDIVRENGNDQVILALHEKRSCVDDRRAIKLTVKQAVRLARYLTGITSTYPGADDDTLDDLPSLKP